MEMLPNAIKHSLAVGIGLLIALAGFQYGGVVGDGYQVEGGGGVFTPLSPRH